MLDIPPIGSLSENEQFAIQRYLMYTTRLSLLEALLRSHPPAAPQAMHGNPSPSATQPIDRVRLGTTLTLVSMSLIKYAFGASLVRPPQCATLTHRLTTPTPPLCPFHSLVDLHAGRHVA